MLTCNQMSPFIGPAPSSGRCVWPIGGTAPVTPTPAHAIPDLLEPWPVLALLHVGYLSKVTFSSFVLGGSLA